MYYLTIGTFSSDETDYIGYGIGYCDAGETHTLENISTDRKAIESLVERCNALKLSPIHLKEVAEDLILSSR